MRSELFKPALQVRSFAGEHSAAHDDLGHGWVAGAHILEISSRFL